MNYFFTKYSQIIFGSSDSLKKRERESKNKDQNVIPEVDMETW